MGKAAARFIQGRLLMHGAPTSTPVTLVEHVSRAEQRILATTLAELPLAAAELSGPAIILLGLAPRISAEAKLEAAI